MACHQEHDLVGVVGGQPNALSQFLDERDALDDVAVAPALADVVQQHAEHQQIRPLDVVQHVRRFRLGRLPRRQRLEILHGEQRVLVDGELVIDVVLDEAGRGVPLGQVPPEESELVHLAEGLRHPSRAPARLSLLLTAALVVGFSATASGADEPVPSQQEVDRARAEAQQARRDVGAVRADLAMAASEIETAQVEAAMAAEAYNGALYELEQARAAAADARRAAKQATGAVRSQQEAYGEALVRSYQSAPTVAGVAAMVAADGVTDFVEQRVTMDNAVDALEGRYDSFRASATVAELSSGRASDAEATAARMETEARGLRDRAADSAATAEQRAVELTARKDQLITEMAELEGISVGLARTRQTALEERARVEAEAARRAEQRRREVQADNERRATEAAARRERAEQARRERERAEREKRTASRTTPRTPEPRPTATRAPAPEPTVRTDATPPAPASGAAAAIAFAEAQLGEPYVWGAAGPDAWDCSGLTARAWPAGGKTLPH